MTETLARLHQKRAARRRRQRGITLLEILIVLAIIGLVMALLVGPAVMKAFFGSKVSTAKIQMRKFAYEAYPQWVTQHAGKRPPCPDQITDLTPFMNNDDVNDPWGNPYLAKCEPSPKGGFDYVVISLGEDGKQGGTGNAADLDSRSLKDSE
jgi:general secretion pathway protein G